MPDKNYRTLPLTFERGLVETVEDSMLPPGACAKCQNWVPDPSGNLRVRRGWLKGSTTGAPSTRQGWGIGHLALQRRPVMKQRSTIGTTAPGTDPQDVSATWPAATVTGSLLVYKLWIQNASTSRAASAYTITPPAGFTLVSPEGTARRSQCFLLYKENAASESGSKTVNVAVAAGADTIYLGLELVELANMATTSPLDQTASSNNTTATSQPSGTTAAVGTPVGYAIAIFSAEVDGDAAYTAPTNDFTEIAEVFVNNSTLDLNGTSCEKMYEAGGTQSTTVTLSIAPQAGGGSVGLIATFKAGSYTTTDGFFTVANKEDSSTINIYYIDRSNIASGTWTLLESLSVSPDVIPVAFATGEEKLFYTHPSFTATRQWGGLGTTPAALANAPAGRCIAYHKNRLFVAGTTSEPWKLFFSETGDHTTWSGGTAGFIEVGNGDGEAIEDITPFEDGLLIGKQTSLWYLTGSGPDNHRLIRLPSQTGIAPGRTITPTPYGAVLAGRKSLMIFSGGSVTTYSSAVVDTYGLTDDWMSGAIVNDVYYCLDQGSGTIWSLDLTEGVWHTEVVGTSGEMPAVLYNQDDKLLFSPANATVGSILQFRLEPGSTRQKDYATISQVFEAWTPEIWPVGPEEKITPRHLFLKLRQRNGDATDTGLTITPVYDGRAQTARTITPNASAGVYWKHISIGEERGVSSFQLKFTQTVPDGDSVLFDIEEATVGFDIQTVAGR